MLKRQKPPVHPGIILREDVIKEHALTVTDAAKMLGVTRTALSDVLNGKAAISAEMAFRIEAVFGGTADIWTRLQMKYQNWFASEKVQRLKLKPFKPQAGQHGYA
ncbi:MAG TPA: HigA family addiction module antitoxin [Puia sp.]|nr:HigA family addiction module antitoxin [Puia sp.]